MLPGSGASFRLAHAGYPERLHGCIFIGCFTYRSLTAYQQRYDGACQPRSFRQLHTLAILLPLRVPMHHWQDCDATWGATPGVDAILIAGLTPYQIGLPHRAFVSYAITHNR